MKKRFTLIAVMSIFLLISCSEKSNNLENESINKLNGQTKTLQENTLYAHTIMRDAIEYRLLINYYTLALIQNGMDINGFDTSQDPSNLENKIDSDRAALQYLNNPNNLPYGPGGPKDPIPVPRPCLHEIFSLIKGNPQNILNFDEGQLEEIGFVIPQICEPSISIRKESNGNNSIILVLNNGFTPNNISVISNNEFISEVTDMYQDDYDQLNMLIEFYSNANEATLTLDIDIPTINSISIQTKLILIE